jgi:polysaccharide export outer membrane protein
MAPVTSAQSKSRPFMSQGTTRAASIILIALSLTGCMPGGDLPSLPPAGNVQYRLGSGDQVRIITYNETQLSNTFTVGDNGTIALPLVGTVQASGMTSGELASNISSILSKKQLISDASVSVEITTYRPIAVLGEVNHPGEYPYQPGMTMLTAVALAGGFTYRAVTDYASDVRHEGQADGHAIKGRIDPETTLKPGDVVTIFERYF